MSKQPLTLWLSITDRPLHDLIQRLAHTTGTVPFQPHVTLIGDIQGRSSEELENIVQQLVVTGPRSFPLKFNKLSRGRTLFKTLYLEVEENDDLTALYDQACKLLLSSAETLERKKFHPHLSLLYEEDFDPRTDGVMGSLIEFFHLGDAFCLDEAVGLSDTITVYVQSIDIVECPLDRIQDWRIVKSIPLAAPLRHR